MGRAVTRATSVPSLTLGGYAALDPASARWSTAPIDGGVFGRASKSISAARQWLNAPRAQRFKSTFNPPPTPNTDHRGAKPLTNQQETLRQSGCRRLRRRRGRSSTACPRSRSRRCWPDLSGLPDRVARHALSMRTGHASAFSGSVCCLHADISLSAAIESGPGALRLRLSWSELSAVGLSVTNLINGESRAKSDRLTVLGSASNAPLHRLIALPRRSR